MVTFAPSTKKADGPGHKNDESQADEETPAAEPERPVSPTPPTVVGRLVRAVCAPFALQRTNRPTTIPPILHNNSLI